MGDTNTKTPNPYLLAIVTGIVSLCVMVIGGKILANHKYNVGKTEGEKGKKAGFDNIPIQINLDNTKWQISYEDMPPDGAAVPAKPPELKPPAKKTTPTPIPTPTPYIKLATVSFNQYGSRLVGEAQDLESRRWIIEGAVAERRVCYIYYDRGGALSFGSACLEMNNAGNILTGKWSGWSPESTPPQPRNLILTKQH